MHQTVVIYCLQSSACVETASAVESFCLQSSACVETASAVESLCLQSSVSQDRQCCRKSLSTVCLSVCPLTAAIKYVHLCRRMVLRNPELHARNDNDVCMMWTAQGHTQVSANDNICYGHVRCATVVDMTLFIFSTDQLRRL